MSSKIKVYFDMNECASLVPATIIGKYTINTTNNGFFENCGFESGNFTNWSQLLFPSFGSTATTSSTEGCYQGISACLAATYLTTNIDGYISADLSLTGGDQIKYKYKVTDSQGACTFAAFLSEVNYTYYPLTALTSPATCDWVEVRVNEETLPATFNRTCKLYFYVTAGAP